MICVFPGVAELLANGALSKALISELLPTLLRPKKTISVMLGAGAFLGFVALVIKADSKIFTPFCVRFFGESCPLVSFRFCVIILAFYGCFPALPVPANPPIRRSGCANTIPLT